MISFYRDIVALLEKGQNLVLATVISESGSAPRSAGAKMAVKPDGSILGTVGGGKLEAAAIQRAKEVFDTRTPVIQPFNLTAKDAAGTDMICGGVGEMLLDYIDADDPDNLAVFHAAAEAMAARTRAHLVMVVDNRSDAAKPRQLCLIRPDGTMAGKFEGDELLLNKLRAGAARISIHGDAYEGMRFFVEPVLTGGRLYIFGGGHVGREIAVMADRVGFMTVVLDDRAEFANSERFPNSEVHLLESFDKLPRLDIDNESYIVIVTRGHLNDGAVLEYALKTDAYYIGMIGSRTKRDLLYKSLESKGFAREALEAVHAPIGLMIGAETPAEIAVSVVAELIQERAKKDRAD